MARSLYRTVELSGFTPDDDWADGVGAPADEPIQPGPYTRKLHVWAIVRDGPLETDARVGAATLEYDFALVFEDSGGDYSTSASNYESTGELAVPGRRYGDIDIPVDARLHVRLVSITGSPAAGGTHLFLYWEKASG